MAAQLGYPNVDAMTRGMTSTQITEWEAYYRMEPFTADRVEIMLAHFIATYVNANRRKGKAAIALDKFMLFLGKNHLTEEQKAVQERIKIDGYFNRIKGQNGSD